MIQVRPIFALVFAALWPFFLGITALLDPSATSSKGGTGIVVGAALLVVIAGLAYEARRDIWRTANFVAWICTAPVLVAGVVVVIGESNEARLKALGVVVPFLALGLASLVFVLRNQLAKDEVPNLLQERFPKARIWEAEGVQWSGVSNTAIVGADGAWLSIFLQNCVAAPRKVQITLQDAGGLLGLSGGLSWPALVPVELGAGEVGALHLRITPTGTRSGDVRLYIAVAADGPPGKRMRRWHARVGSKRISPSLTVLGMLGGVIAWGGGVRLTFSVPGVAVGRPSLSSAPLRWEPLWPVPEPLDEPLMPQIARSPRFH
ncbi:MAG TPA: hypothetical protein VER96_41245 [Polyangiaceae bacterium]|nr:hypothetical protein [Polyangiaceae bacterium]